MVELARGILEQDPCREDATRLVMRAHMLRGDRTAAIRAYQSCVRALEREFGLEPLPETQRLYEDARSARR
ncbi:MAG: bacterial transcriptional activator domain-containing protein [Chloroflexia bacterium]